MIYEIKIIILNPQEIKRDNEGTRSCKIALYRTFLECGARTWEKVIIALEHSGHCKIAEKAKIQLVKHYNKVINICSFR